MLRFICVISVVFVFLSFNQPVLAQTSSQQVNQTIKEDFVKQCIGPAVQKAVDEYYGEHRTIAYWQMDVLDINRLREGSYWFEITVRVKTSKGPFNPPYGIETITLTNKTKPGEGKYKVIKFVHQDEIINSQHL